MCMTPDSRMVSKVQSYDSDLFIVWNNRKQYFELRRKQAVSNTLITPVTQSIYDAEGTITFAPLDERLLWWIYEADSWAHGGPKLHALKGDTRWIEYQKIKDKAKYASYHDRAKDMWHQLNNKYVTRYKSRNSKFPVFGNKKKQTAWIRPDVGARTSPRLFSRSTANAKRYNYQK